MRRLATRCYFAAALLALLGGSTRLAAEAAPQGARRSEGELRRAQFTKVCAAIRDRFYDKSFGGNDWDKITERYAARIPAVTTKAGFKTLVNEMLSELHSSHTEYADDTDVDYSMLSAVMDQDLDGHRVAHIGVMGRRVNGEFLVSAVYDGGPADKAGLHSGDVIVSAGGGAFETAGSFKGREGQVVTLRVRRAGASHVDDVPVTPVKQNVIRAFLDATAASARVITLEGRRLGYVHLWTMGNDAFKTTLDALVLGKLHDTDGLILDLRDGYGGNPFGYADVFFLPDIAWEQQYRGAPRTTRFLGYGKPMVALINGGSRSAKEFFTYELKKTHRATLVGLATAGAFLGAGKVDIGPDGVLELPVVGLRLDGKKLEGAGVAPDIAVLPAHPYTTEDSQLLRGEAVLAEKIRSQVDPPAGTAGR